MADKKPSREKSHPAAQRSFEAELAALEAMAAARPSPDGIARLRAWLGHRNNFIVAKAARLVADAGLVDLLAEVFAAFDRFFIDAVKSDPQCWAKDALIKAMARLGHRSKDAYLRGMQHHQLEPVWGGLSDTAGGLRCASIHGLLECTGISDMDLLGYLVEPVTDPDKTVRMEAVRAIGQVGGVSGMLLLRMRALLGKDEPEVLGACFSSLLALEGRDAVGLVARSLKNGDDVSAEAAYALAELHVAESAAALMARRRAGADEWFGSVLDSAIALTRLPEAFDFLIATIERGAREAVSAIEAIGRIAPPAELRSRVEAAVRQADSTRLEQAFREFLPPLPDGKES